MKTLIAAVALLAAGTTLASAQEWRRDLYPYEARHHEFCQRTGREIWRLERLVAERRSNHRERETLLSLQRERDARCHGWRYQG
jgi:hypothetical protein